MSTPHYIIISDSEDKYPHIPTVELSDFDSDMDMDNSPPLYESHVTSHFPPTSDDEIVTHPTSTEPFEEEEEEPSEEDPSEEEIETSSTHTPVVTLPTPIPPPPPYYMTHGSCSRATARKSVRLPRQELAEPIDDTFYTDIPVVTSTPTPTTPIPTPTTTATAPVFTTPTAAATTSAPQQDHSSRYREWMHTTLQTWRQVEGLPSTFELGESSTTPASASVTPILVAQLARQEREQRALRLDLYRLGNTGKDSLGGPQNRVRTRARFWEIYLSK